MCLKQNTLFERATTDYPDSLELIGSSCVKGLTQTHTHTHTYRPQAHRDTHTHTCTHMHACAHTYRYTQAQNLKPEEEQHPSTVVWFPIEL